MYICYSFSYSFMKNTALEKTRCFEHILCDYNIPEAQSSSKMELLNFFSLPKFIFSLHQFRV